MADRPTDMAKAVARGTAPVRYCPRLRDRQAGERRLACHRPSHNHRRGITFCPNLPAREDGRTWQVLLARAQRVQNNPSERRLFSTPERFATG